MSVKIPLYIKWNNLICKICKKMTSCQIEYEDLFQVSVIAILEIDDSKIKTNEFSFVRRTIINACLSYINDFEDDPLSTAISIDDVFSE